MIRTADPVSGAFNLYKNAAPVQSAPDLGIRRCGIITRAALPAVRAVILVPGIRVGLDAEVSNTICIIVEIVRFYNRVLDIEQFLT